MTGMMTKTCFCGAETDFEETEEYTEKTCENCKAGMTNKED